MTVLALAVAGCAERPVAERSPVARRELAIIGGDAAAARSGIAHLTHARGGQRCSGVLIDRELVATGMHCVIERTGDGDRLLSVEGFVVGFGADSSQLTRRAVADVAWVGAPDALSIDDAALAGEDVAVLRLAEPAPDEETVHGLDLELAPKDGQAVLLAGYGITDVRLGTSGVRAAGAGRITGFAQATGIIQIEGDGACLGDSGGPVLDADSGKVVGVIGAFGSTDAGLCALGLTFAATPANPDVRRLLAKQCAAVGGCAERTIREAGVADGGGDGDGGRGGRGGPDRADATVDAGDAGEPVDAAIDGGAKERGPMQVDADARQDDGGCAVVSPGRASTRGYSCSWAALAFALGLGWRARTRGRSAGTAVPADRPRRARLHCGTKPMSA